MANQPAVQTFYVPLPEDQLLDALQILEPPFFPGDPFAPQGEVNTYISIAPIANQTVVYYDHAEDGYELDIANPTQATTQIWGDGDLTNGIAPLFANDFINAGDVLVLNNLVDPTNLSGVIDFDGGDKIGVTKPVAVTRAAWALGSDTLLAGAVEVYDTNNYGLNYVVPVGEDLSNDVRDPDSANSLFEYTGLVIQAATDGTVVNIAPEGATGSITTVTLNEGESHSVQGGVNAGATVSASAPVQVNLLTGDIGAGYETRWFSLLPADQLSNSFYTPVGTDTRLDPTYVWLHNSNGEDITVEWNTVNGAETSFVLPAGDTVRRTVPNNSGAHFFSNSVDASGAPLSFYALTTVDSDASSERGGGDGNQDHDWGMTLIPEDRLTSQVTIGLGLGRDPESDVNQSENGSPVWVTPVGNGSTPVRVLVDYNGDGVGALTDANGNQYDAEFELTELQSQKVLDPDGDQTGMLLYVEDPNVRLAAAWGQDPATATAGSPGFDVGTGIPPLPSFTATKVSELVTDADGDGVATPGDTIRYDIRINNISRVPVPDVVLNDPLPAETVYVPGSAVIDYGAGEQVITAGATNNPFQAGINLNTDITPGVELGALPVNGEFVVSFEVEVEPIETLEPGTVEIQNRGTVSAIGQGVPIEADTPLTFEPALDIQKTVALEHNDGASFADSGELVSGVDGTAVTYYFELTNTGSTFLDGITLADGTLGLASLADFTLLNGDATVPLAPGASQVYYYEGSITADLVNTATTIGTPTYSDGTPITVDLDGDPSTPNTVSDDDTAEVDLLELSTIAGTVFEDTNNDDGGDVPIEGVTVELRDTNDVVVGTTLTGADGTYLFEDVLPGSYSVTQTNLPTYTDVADSDGGDPNVISIVDLPPATDSTGNDFIDERLSSIAGTVFEDTDNDDIGDQALGGVTVELLDAADVVIDSAVTDANGDYFFSDLNAGDYSVVQTNLPDYVDVGDSDGDANGPNRIDVALPPATESIDNDFVDELAEPEVEFRKLTSADGVTYSDANSVDDAVEVFAGDTVYWRYEVANTGNVALDGISINDDHGTPGDASDDLLPTLVAASDANGNGLLDPGETWVYEASAVAEDLLFSLDFEADGSGNTMVAGQLIDDEFAAQGLTVSNPDIGKSKGNPGFGAMIFDSANPTGGDWDLGTPAQPAGPGIGKDAGASAGNAIAQGNVLIISEDGDANDPDDNADGGTLRFGWDDRLVRLVSVGLLDIDLNEQVVTVVSDRAGSMVNSYDVPNLGDNSQQILALQGEWADQLDINFIHSGAITAVTGIGSYRNTATLEVLAGASPLEVLTAQSHYTNPLAVLP